MEFAALRIEIRNPIIGVAVHDGHELRAEVAGKMQLDEETRRREEDPYTGMLASALPNSLVLHRSRFEIDVNRPRSEAVYRKPADAWGLELWESDLEDEIISRSLHLYDTFYARLGEVLDKLVDRHGGFVLYDIHSYNHRRAGPAAAPAPQEENPDVNVGTGTLPPRWKPVAETFLETARDAGFDARENVKFEGRQVAAWVHHLFGDVACALAIEFKKTFMDEWTNQVHRDELKRMSQLLAASVDPVLESCREQWQ